MENSVYTQETYDKYFKAAEDYARMWGITDVHVIEIMTSVMLHRDNLRPGGGFVQSVVANDLYQAINRADDTCIKYLKQIVAAKYNCHVR
jgi:hypothetical protein